MLRAARLLRAFCSRSRVTPARQACVSLACGTILLVSPLLQASSHQLSKLPPFDRAERLQEALQAHPASQRSRLDYERVLDAYRAVYHGDPASPKADTSIFAVAGLLAEEGRLFSDEKLLHDAIGQYEFLRQQYPSSRYRFSALITEGVIYRHDIGDREAAKEKFQLFLKTYPQNPLAEQARSELTELHHPPHEASHATRNPVLSAAIESQQPRPATVVTTPAIQPQP